MKKNLSVQDADELAAKEADPMYSINAGGISEDIKRAMGKLNTEDAAKASRQFISNLPTCWPDLHDFLVVLLKCDCRLEKTQTWHELPLCKLFLAVCWRWYIRCL